MVFLRSVSDPSPLIYQGTWEGSVIFEPRGEKGFGYDPIFWVAEYNCTAAELLPEIKNKISHRAKALEKLIKGLKGVRHTRESEDTLTPVDINEYSRLHN
jgi:XTP/dITP diphosphohydrolase